MTSIWLRTCPILRIFLCVCLVGCAVSLTAGPYADLQLTYLASFGNGSLKGSVDKSGIGPLQPGDSQVPNMNSSWTPLDGAIEIGISRPTQPLVGPVGAGLFATPVNFGAGSVVGLSATFIAPLGPHNIGDTWAVSVSARTGNHNDLAADTRTSATFQVRGPTARLNVVGAAAPANQPNIPQEIYDAIFDPEDPEPFTLEFLIDRTTGTGTALLRVGNWVTSHNFQFAVFEADSGPALTAVGPSIAMSNAPGQRASVWIGDFRIYAPMPRP